MSNIFLDSVKKVNVSKDDDYISLNDTGDLTRMAYSNKSSDIPLRNSSLTDRFESDTFTLVPTRFLNCHIFGNCSCMGSVSVLMQTSETSLPLIPHTDVISIWPFTT